MALKTFFLNSLPLFLVIMFYSQNCVDPKNVAAISENEIILPKKIKQRKGRCKKSRY